MPHQSLALAGAVLAFATWTLGARDAAVGGEAKVTSGPAVGTKTPQFDNHGVTGPWKGNPKVCYV